MLKYSIVYTSVAILLLSPLLLLADGPPSSRPTASPRAARSVHLGYPSVPALAFYNEVTVGRSTPGSYFMACGFSHGYFGIQEQSNASKVVLFSVWDPTRGDDPKAVPDERRVEVIYKADDVTVKRFGGEGTGGQSFFRYNWKIGQTCRFLVKATVLEKRTAYAGYCWLPENKAWKHLITFRTATGGTGLEGLYSFIEDFRRDTKSAAETRRALFGNGWALDAGEKWHPLTRARFTASGAEWEAKDTIDAGVTAECFYLQTGGDTKPGTPLGTTLQRRDDGTKLPEMPAE
jgi:hypothetical protein